MTPFIKTRPAFMGFGYESIVLLNGFVDAHHTLLV